MGRTRHKRAAQSRPPEEPLQPKQTSICTKDSTCMAEADKHEPDCPKEIELKATFGF